MSTESIKQLLLETWVEYGISTLAVVLRMGVRLRMQGIRGLDWDDYLMPVAWGFLTAMSVAAAIVSANGSNGGLGTDEERLAIVTDTPELAAMYTYGAKLFLVGWYTYTGFLWTLKLCMLFLLKRVTQGVPIGRIIKPLIGIVIVFWIAIIILVSCLCRPFSHYWQVYPDPGDNCTPGNGVFYIAVLVLNLGTDACIVAIPLPILIGARMALSKKLAVGGLLCAGVFVMIAAIMRVVFVFESTDPAAPAIWACRETLVAMLAVNAPLIAPIAKRRFWQPPDSNNSTSAFSRNKRSGHIELSEQQRSTNKKKRHPNDLDTFLAKDQTTVIDIESSSTERIYQPSDNGIRVQRDFVIKTEMDNQHRS